jgi:hypothetical protein
MSIEEFLEKRNCEGLDTGDLIDFVPADWKIGEGGSDPRIFLMSPILTLMIAILYAFFLAQN